ncbi:uncharacterized protein BDZ99DRAFT_508858 [Mytilinidion resinicola]|uniref:Mitochondrial distribution and morphology protein family 31/32 n=1 Tax=Mytilinidion resinicola TaxID=574789 RepID=A0A6A6YRB0_9PEZI|nr:uncharacterized protein BDZ99DRAFT_508858 [Mytilinidion resinicola]KAF2810427.1 hypothetical protein BDZ99DRAFT_508858 [Mytilinidion resinicola]
MISEVDCSMSLYSGVCEARQCEGEADIQRTAATREQFPFQNSPPAVRRLPAASVASPGNIFASGHDPVTTSASLAWRRHLHHQSFRANTFLGISGRRYKSSLSGKATPAPAPNGSAPKAELSPDTASKTPAKESPESPPAASHPASKPLLERIPQSLPHFHRPTKDELLAAATGFWSRLKVHFKWLTIRSSRPFNTDDISAFVSWILLGHIIWIIVGTTTFFSLTIFLINTVFAQESLAKWIGNYLTSSSGVKVVFESAVVPKWRDGVISFKRVFVSRRPGQGQSNVTKGSQLSAAAEAAAIAQKERDIANGVVEEEDTNYTQFDVSIDTVNVTLSFAKWFNGKGLLKDVEVRGIRGVVDRTSVRPPEEYIDPRTYKHEHQPGDFELDSFKMEDLLVTVYQPNNFRPFSVSIFSCDLPQLRKQWLFYDFLSANMMSGSFDNSLFTIHPRQTHNYTGAQLTEGRETENGISWKKHSRIRIDALSIDHLNRGYEGPFSWIHEGNVDIVADIMIPNENDDSIAKFMSDFYDRVEATVTSNGNRAVIDNSDGKEVQQPLSPTEAVTGEPEDNRFIIMDLRVHLNDVRASVPILTSDITYINNALVRPIVAYINSKKTFIPVNCRVVKRASEFDGSWTIYDSGLMDDLSREMYDAFARDVLDDNSARKRRFKKVGIWTLQLAAQALFIGLAGNIA